MMKRLSAALRQARSIWSDRRGNVLMIFGLALVPIIFATGMGIDYASAMRLRTKLDAAADAASLSATTTPMLNKTFSEACTTATNMFIQQSQPSTLPGLTLNTSDPAQFSVVITETYAAAGSVPITATCGSLPAAVASLLVTPTSRVATVTYHGKSVNNFAGILGLATLNVSGLSKATVGLASYYQIVFAVDTSNSMGIGGDSTQIGKLNSDPQISCAFACHDPNATGSTAISVSGWCESNPADSFCRSNVNYCPFGTGNCGTKYPSVTYADKRGLAKAFGYKLKIDYVNDAVSSFIDSLQTPMQKAPNNYSVSIYTFGTGALSGSNNMPGSGMYSPIQPATTDWTTLKLNSGKIDVEVASKSPNGFGNQGWTYTSNALQNIRNSLTNVGDGSSATARKTYIIFLSDGVENVFDASNALGMYNRLTNYNYAQQCQAIKNAGITMFSIEAAYAPIPGDPQYNVLVAGLPGRNGGTQIADVMQGCASSPSRYFLASDGPAIQTAVQSVFASIAAEASRITQ